MKQLAILLTTLSLLAVGAAAVAGPTTTTAPKEKCTCSEDGPVFGPGLETGDQTP